MKTALAVALALTAGMAYANDEDNPDKALLAGVVRLAASMNGLAQSCGHMSAKDVETARANQRAAALKDMQASPAEYDRSYAQFSGEFKTRWASMSKPQQKQACDQMKTQGR